MDEEKAAQYIARAAELRNIAAEAGPGDRDALIRAAEAYERLAQRIIADGSDAPEALPAAPAPFF